jgi:hypothetical protein
MEKQFKAGVGIAVVGIVLIIIAFFFLSGCNATLSSYYLKKGNGVVEYGYGEYNKKQYEEMTFYETHRKKQSLLTKRYSITEIEKMSENKFRVFGTDRDAFIVGNFMMTKEELDFMLNYQTEDKDYVKIGW